MAGKFRVVLWKSCWAKIIASLRLATTNIWGSITMTDSKVLFKFIFTGVISYAGLLRRTHGNYKVSFHCINLLYLPNLALVNRTWCIQTIVCFVRCRGPTRRGRYSHSSSARMFRFIFPASDMVVIFLCHRSKVRQTFSMNPRHEFSSSLN